MKQLINITWLTDRYDCDQAGCSGGYSEGALVTLNGVEALKLIPVASCFGGDSWDQEDVFVKLLELLGYDVEIK